ncbi:hypothetical protein [Porphyrobacter sp. ULC335]|uniref:hypothetical protein n=1 Tax=Porphyrobacter sp. ULC335 TaxID=2854260 RepID=UPI00221E7E28|nr:hypothetical protein [Porphyrobacter sp. ULC335]UYV15982.1 hypothetical protein KVF90_01105 [Porphyrobacter sp. ULC335]
MSSRALIPALCLMTGAAVLGALGTPGAAQTVPNGPERGVFVTQIGDGSRTEIVQQNSDSLAQIVQDGEANQIDLAQKGAAPHRAQIAQDGDGNLVDAQQDGDGSTDLALLQEGNGNSALVMQSEISAAEQTSAAIAQRGNGNRLILAQNGSDNSAELEQLGDANTMSATQLDSGNHLEWSQIGDGLADLQITQTGGGNLQVTQSNTGAQFAPPPGG